MSFACSSKLGSVKKPFIGTGEEATPAWEVDSFGHTNAQWHRKDRCWNSQLRTQLKEQCWHGPKPVTRTPLSYFHSTSRINSPCLSCEMLRCQNFSLIQTKKNLSKLEKSAATMNILVFRPFHCFHNAFIWCKGQERPELHICTEPLGLEIVVIGDVAIGDASAVLKLGLSLAGSFSAKPRAPAVLVTLKC